MSSNSVFLSVAFPDIDILHPALLSVPPRTMCLFNYWIAYIREGRVLKVASVALRGSDALASPQVNCVKIQPAWMREMADLVGPLQVGLEEVMIREVK